MKILLVDDSKTVIFLTIKMLRDFGYTDIIAANDYHEAVTLLNTTVPDLIISDMHMPEQSGLDLLHYIRQTPALFHVPFILMTTFGDTKIINQALHDGAQDVMYKPLEEKDLFEKLLALSKSHSLAPPKDHRHKFS